MPTTSKPLNKTTMSVRAQIEKRSDGYNVKVNCEKRVTPHKGGFVRRTSDRREFGPFNRARAHRLVEKFEAGFFNVLL